MSRDVSDVCLAQHLHNVPILALGMSCRRQLALYMDNDVIPTQDGRLPNYLGLAELIGFNFLEQLSFQRHSSPTVMLLQEWGSRTDLEPSLGHFFKMLLELNRLDVLKNCMDIVSKVVFMLLFLCVSPLLAFLQLEQIRLPRSYLLFTQILSVRHSL